MKITLEFNGEDEMFQARCAVEGFNLWSALSDIDSGLRSRYKHGDISDEEADFIERLREITMIINEY